MKLKATVYIFLLSGFLVSTAQESDPINTDRPTQSASALVMPKGKIQLEAGFTSESINPVLTSLTYFNGLLRWGIFDGVELRITQNYLELRESATDFEVRGLSPTTIGTKVHLLEEQGAAPQISVLGQVTLTNGNTNFQPTAAVTELRLNFQHTLSEDVGLGYNLGTVFSDGRSLFLYSAVVGLQVADGLTVFAEPYGFLGDGPADQRINFGVIYLTDSRLQFDASAGVGMTEISPDSFIGFGVSYLFN